MTNSQLYIAIGLPCLTLIFSFALQFFAIRDLRSETREFRTELRSDFRDFKAEIREDLQSMRAAIEILTGKVIEIDKRLSVIEDRYGRP